MAQRWQYIPGGHFKQYISLNIVNHIIETDFLGLFCVCVKRIKLCNCLCSSSPSFRFSASRDLDFKIINQYSWSLSMADRGSEFSFFSGIHVRTEIRIGISIFIRPMTTKFGKEVHLEELTRVRHRCWWRHHVDLQVLVMSSHQVHQTNLKHLHYQGAFGHQIWQDGNFNGLLPMKSHELLITWSSKTT